MRIDAAELVNIELPLRVPERTNYGVNLTRNVVLVHVMADGLHGWGEAAPSSDPIWNYEYPGTTWPLLRDYLIPAVVGKDLDEPEDVSRIYGAILGRGIRGHHFAKAALEMAIWDVFARAAGTPLSVLFGGVRDRVPVGVSVGIQDTPAELVRVVGGFLEQGYQRLKIKIMPGRDLEDLRAVREAFSDARIMTDANSSYTLEDIPLLQSMDELDLMMHEQPLGWDDIVDHAKLVPVLQTPICLDESILSLGDVRKAVELGSCQIINIKTGRLGGHQAVREVHDFMHALKLPVWCGGMYESGVGRAHNLHLATMPGFTLPGDTSASERYFPEDIVDEPAVLNADGTVDVPTRPGIGVEVLEDRLKRYTLRTWSTRE
jgi:O-succinylbenzoate synthase